MPIFDLNRELNQFYDEHVALGAERRRKLAGYRDACLDRLKHGLEVLGAERGVKYVSFIKTIGQGSYTMHTLNQHRNDQYDIDEAVIFAKGGLPAKASDARQLVADALLKAGGNFTKEPEARSNAVTVWYADGAHVDLAIYREVDGFFTSHLEHAGTDWAQRDPAAITSWFKEQVSEKSPLLFLGVREDQLRRVVRWVKAFARSRLSWSLPGGMVLTTLVIEVYRADRARDDIALYETLKALKGRLAISKDVTSPIDLNCSLTSKPKMKAQVNSFAEKLDKAIAALKVLEKETCTRAEAMGAWGRFFNHDFWAAPEVEGPPDPGAKAGVAKLEISVGVAKAKGAKTMPYKSAETPVPKGRWFRFVLPDPWQDLSDARYRWVVTNTGDEAKVANDMGHEVDGNGEEWRSAAYRGVHSMTCEILRDGAVVARGVRRVQVARR